MGIAVADGVLWLPTELARADAPLDDPSVFARFAPHGRIAAIVAHARSRLADQLLESSTRLVSLYDPDAHPIRKGQIDRPAEFGSKAQATDDDGIVVDYAVEYGAARTGRSSRPPQHGSPGAPTVRPTTKIHFPDGVDEPQSFL